MDEYQASIQDLRRSQEWALQNRSHWEAVAVLLNEHLKTVLGPVAYAETYGTSALSTLFAQVSEPARHE